ncbi:MAG TPA: phospholipase D-like domain-containing protein [Asanoa sp.]
MTPVDCRFARRSTSRPRTSCRGRPSSTLCGTPASAGCECGSSCPDRTSTSLRCGSPGGRPNDALLGAGVEPYEYQPTMLHAKTMVVDGGWVTVGSVNFDNRSFRLHDEATCAWYRTPLPSN